MTVESTAPPKFVLQVTPAWLDIVRGAASWPLWGRLGWLEIKRRYRRTVIGPFWSAISLAVFVFALGTLGSGLWNQHVSTYMPYLVAGMVLWMLVSAVLTESCIMFISSAGMVQQTRFDYSILVYAMLWRNLIVFGHNFVIYLITAVIFAPELFAPRILLAIPGLALLMLNGIWVALFLSVLCLRFRDLQQLVGTLIQISLFATPIFWTPDNLQGVKRLIFVDLNPLYHMIEVARAPLLGKVPTLEDYAAVALITVVGWAIAFGLFRKFRRRIAYWI
jgi:ABC-type polysaccharide/polyol phosphate export permease